MRIAIRRQLDALIAASLQCVPWPARAIQKSTRALPILMWRWQDASALITARLCSTVRVEEDALTFVARRAGARRHEQFTYSPVRLCGLDVTRVLRRFFLFTRAFVLLFGCDRDRFCAVGVSASRIIWSAG